MTEKLKVFSKNYWILVLMLVIKMILQYLLINPVYELHRDEFLYLDQGEHPAFGYISVPPFMAMISKIVYLFGGGLFWIRFFPALFGALTILFVWLIIESAGGGLYAKILGSAALLFSTLARINILYQPNSFDILSWTIIFYFLIRLFQTNEHKWLWYLAVIIALGLYNKYNVIFLIAGLAAGLALTKERRIFTRFAFWKALILSLLILSPNIIWQITHHFPVFQHMKVLKANQLDNNSASDFLKSQVMFFFGSLPLTLLALASFIFYKPFRQYRFAGISFVTVITLFAAMKAKGYYSVGIYPVMFAFGSVYIESILSNTWKKIVVPVLVGLNLAVFIFTIRVVYPIYGPAEIRAHADKFEALGLLRWEDGKNHILPQDFADMLGWKEMAARAAEAYKSLPPQELGNTLIICNNYGQAGALNYYNRGKMPEAYAFNTDYIYWIPRLGKIKNIVLVGRKPNDAIVGAFKSFRQTGSVENPMAREFNTQVFLMEGANDAFTAVFYNLVAERINKLDIF